MFSPVSVPTNNLLPFSLHRTRVIPPLIRPPSKPTWSDKNGAYFWYPHKTLTSRSWRIFHNWTTPFPDAAAKRQGLTGFHWTSDTYIAPAENTHRGFWVIEGSHKAIVQSNDEVRTRLEMNTSSWLWSERNEYEDRHEILVIGALWWIRTESREKMESRILTETNCPSSQPTNNEDVSGL